MRIKAVPTLLLVGAIVATGWSSTGLLRLADAATNPSPTSAGSPSPYQIIVNGAPIKLAAPARLSGNVMMVPLRSIAEALGSKVSYDNQTQTVTAVKDGITLKLQINRTTAHRNGKSVQLQAAPILENGVTLVPVRWFSEAFGTTVKWDGPGGKVHIDDEAYLLPAVGSYKELKQLLAATGRFTYGEVSFGRAEATMMADSAATSMKASAAAEAAPSAAGSGTASEYSTTNVQVEGVDEADVVKTDGQYIYQVNRERVMIVKAYPAEEMSLAATLSLKDYKLSPQEIYVDGDRLVVIGSGYPEEQLPSPIVPAEPGEVTIMPVMPRTEAKMMLPMPFYKPTIKTLLFDISDRTQPKVLKEVETDGHYVTSRKVGTELYVITNKYMDGYAVIHEKEELPAPSYRDSAVASKGWQAIPYNKLRYLPGSNLDAYVMITGIDTAKPEQPAAFSSYLGSAENVYASADSLYITVSNYNQTVVPLPAPLPVEDLMSPREEAAEDNDTTVSTSDQLVDSTEPVIAIVPPDYQPVEVRTSVYKFRLQQTEARFAAKGEVPGTVLNQFSMDEHKGFFRIATTKGDMWRTDAHTSSSQLYILDEGLNQAGKVENIAPGERIYSVRFMGDKGYMVTFKNVDPLFVLDLANPYKPRILGELKIPGYSDYLFPYDENHLIGFGKDAVEGIDPWSAQQGINAAPTAYYQGLKLAMFDVSDVNQPKELFSESIGDRGTDSELLRNHKALTFSKEKGLLAFPVTLMKVDPAARAKQGASAYGEFAYQGAYIYQVDLQNGFRQKGTITHLTDKELAQNQGWYTWENGVDRILYLDNILYTLSQGQIRANRMDTLAEVKRLNLPATQQ